MSSKAAIKMERFIEVSPFNPKLMCTESILRMSLRASGNLIAVNGLADKLLLVAQEAHANMRHGELAWLSEYMLGLPLNRFHESAARYYEAIAMNRLGADCFAAAGARLERLASAPGTAPRFRARSLLTLGGRAVAEGKLRDAMYFYKESLLASRLDNWCDPLASFKSGIGISLVRSLEGDRVGALKDLRGLYDLGVVVGNSYPGAYCIYLSSLAYELAETGELSIARHLINKACNSQYAKAYPEWEQTRQEIEQKLYQGKRNIFDLHHEPVKVWHIAENTNPVVKQKKRPLGNVQDWKDRLSRQARFVLMQKNVIRNRIAEALIDIKKLSLQQMKLALQILTPREEE